MQVLLPCIVFKGRVKLEGWFQDQSLPQIGELKLVEISGL